MQGVVKWFSSEKGYGFITANSGEDYYFNVQGINGAVLPSNGDAISFDSRPGKKGPQAFNVTITAKASPQKSGKIDDRISCPRCGKKIVPRMIIHKGEPEKSVCPYCAATVKQFGKCFIATAVYGDPSCSQVRKLRNYRDEHLKTSIFGRLFIQTYYAVSPPIANWLVKKPMISRKIRAFLDIVVKHIIE